MTALLGRWNTGRWGQPLRRTPGWSHGRTRLIYVHLTEGEWQAVDAAARAVRLTREQWLVAVSQRALATEDAQTAVADAAAAARMQATRNRRTD